MPARERASAVAERKRTLAVRTDRDSVSRLRVADPRSDRWPPATSLVGRESGASRVGNRLHHRLARQRLHRTATLRVACGSQTRDPPSDAASCLRYDRKHRDDGASLDSSRPSGDASGCVRPVPTSQNQIESAGVRDTLHHHPMKNPRIHRAAFELRIRHAAIGSDRAATGPAPSPASAAVNRLPS